MHESALVFDHVPPSHLVHSLLPSSSEYFPLSHAKHEAEPVFEYVPAPHVSHVSDFVWLQVPASQAVHSVLFVVT